jgi:pSer/pThr/pTyr-binding forkhead associated (FHA) protein
MAKLVINGAAHALTDKVITIGRAPDNMIVIDDPSVSERHAQLQLAGEGYRLQDLESTNGTRVNGIPMTETALRFDDRIHFGAVDALFEPDMRGLQPLPQLEALEAKPAELSVTAVDFTNASPSPRRNQKNDPIRIVILAAAAGALLAFLGSMIAVLMMRAPVL